MLAGFVAAAIAQAPVVAVDVGVGRANAEAALAFIRRRDAATAARLTGELQPWLAARPGARIDPAAAPTVRAAGAELQAMFVAHRAMWGGDPGFDRAAAAADAARKALERDLGDNG